MNAASDRVVIGMDPHTRSATIEVMSTDERIVGGGRFATDHEGYAGMRRYAAHGPGSEVGRGDHRKRIGR